MADESTESPYSSPTEAPSLNVSALQAIGLFIFLVLHLFVL